MNIGKELLNLPFPAMIRNMGVSIAEAQYELDSASVRIAQLMSGFRRDNNGNLVKDNSSLIQLKEGGPSLSLLSLGLTPTFYQFVEAQFSLKIDLRFLEEKQFGVGASVTAQANWLFASVAATVNASYSQKYQFEARGSSEFSARLVSVPAPPAFESRLRALLEEDGQ